jgi:hypothetical protein
MGSTCLRSTMTAVSVQMQCPQHTGRPDRPDVGQPGLLVRPVRRESSGLDNRRLSATASISRAGPRIVHEARGWWRWRESNPRPLTVNQDFSGCSALWNFSAPALARTRPLTGPAG